MIHTYQHGYKAQLVGPRSLDETVTIPDLVGTHQEQFLRQGISFLARCPNGYEMRVKISALSPLTVRRYR